MMSEAKNRQALLDALFKREYTTWVAPPVTLVTWDGRYTQEWQKLAIYG